MSPAMAPAINNLIVLRWFCDTGNRDRLSDFTVQSAPAGARA
jgi:hypothetical protein